MTIFRDFSILWSLVHTLLMFILLFEPRFSRKKTLTVLLSIMGPLIALNFFIFLLWGPQGFINCFLLTCTLPSLIVCWYLSKYRDGRFFFVFCLADTIGMEILYVTNIIDYFLEDNYYIFLFVSRLLIFPLLEVFLYKKVLPVIRTAQKQTKKGWFMFTLVGLFFYLSMSLSMGYPTMVTERPEYLPTMVFQFLLMPILYANILTTLSNQQQVYELTQQENILRLQVSNMTTRIEELNTADEKFRMERHDMRHKLQTIAGLVENQQYDQLGTLVQEYSEAIQETQVKRYCSNAVLDTVLSTYLQRAERSNIRVNVSIALPASLPVGEAELATVFANAIENAINACEKLPPQRRYLDVKVLIVPRFMLQISNSFNGSVDFDSNGIPTNHQENHGFGTRSIVAFCEKHSAFYEFKATDDTFSLRIVFR